MNVRRIRESDLKAAHDVLDQLMVASADRRLAMWDRLRSREGCTAWVADADGQVVGFLDLLIWPDVAHGEMVGLVNNLVVAEQARGRGVGERLLREAAAYCGSRDVVELHVWTDFDNSPAVGLYKKLGFTDRALLLELQLKSTPE